MNMHRIMACAAIVVLMTGWTSSMDGRGTAAAESTPVMLPFTGWAGSAVPASAGADGIGSLGTLGMTGAGSVGLVGAQPKAPQIAGHYYVSGDTSKGHYVGEAEVYQKGRAVYVMWTIEGGQEAYGGFGLIVGSTVSVGFTAGPVGAVVVYQIKSDRLVGEWPDESGKLHVEILSKTKPAATRGSPA